jgi:hypothetical protein
MKMPALVRIAVRIAGWAFLSLAVFSVWYWFAADYSYGALAGTYVYRSGDLKSTLILKEDRSFAQEVVTVGKVQHAQGTWRRLGEGGVVFSKEILPPGDFRSRSDGSTDGDVQKSFLELIPSIVLASDKEPGPRFHRQYF